MDVHRPGLAISKVERHGTEVMCSVVCNVPRSEFFPGIHVTIKVVFSRSPDESKQQLHEINGAIKFKSWRTAALSFTEVVVNPKESSDSAVFYIVYKQYRSGENSCASSRIPSFMSSASRTSRLERNASIRNVSIASTTHLCAASARL